jgi:hypothetical protein
VLDQPTLFAFVVAFTVTAVCMFSAVILSAAKDPEGLSLPPLSRLSTQKSQQFRSSSNPPSNRHFARSRSRFLRAAQRRNPLLYFDSRSTTASHLPLLLLVSFSLRTTKKVMHKPICYEYFADTDAM